MRLRQLALRSVRSLPGTGNPSSRVCSSVSAIRWISWCWATKIAYTAVKINQPYNWPFHRVSSVTYQLSTIFLPLSGLTTLNHQATIINYFIFLKILFSRSIAALLLNRVLIFSQGFFQYLIPKPVLVLSHGWTVLSIGSQTKSLFVS